MIGPNEYEDDSEGEDLDLPPYPFYPERPDKFAPQP